MPCYKPLTAYRGKTLTPSGKRSIVFNLNEGYKDLSLQLPCGQCIGCKLERSRQWAIRCVHEASLYQNNCFITLTYSDDKLPPHGSLRLEDFQKFMKRLRKSSESPIRFFHCGEYGEQTSRPHYHACLFNYDFADKYQFTQRREFPIFRSPLLEELWPHGQSEIGTLTFESAAYVARYITKKMTGPGSDIYYDLIDETTGEVFSLKREYTTMSRRPGIGKGWLDKFKTDVYPDDFIILRGKKLKPPRFYDSQLSELEILKQKLRRKRLGEKNADNNTFPRLRVREEIQLLKFDQLKRSYEIK